jgi:Ca2+-binding EF-hand superfamily protein
MMSKAALLAALALACTATLTLAAPEGRGGHMAERFKQADTNGDGKLSREEAAALPMIAKHFDDIDTNKDNFITLDELRAFHEKMHGEHGKGRGDLLKRLDKDGDGRISREEAKAAPRLYEHFDAIDTNKDGYITAEELKAAHDKHQAGK